MKRLRRKHLSCLVMAVAGLLAASAAQATPITVVNQGFEDPSLFGWVNNGFGTFSPWNGVYPGPFPEGVSVAYTNTDGGTLSQVLADALTVGSYSLRVELGRRLDLAFPGYRIQLFAGGFLLAQDDNTLVPPAGTWMTSTVNFTALSTDARLGLALQIQIVGLGGIQPNFDDVRLDFTAAASAVPEPSTLALGAMGSLLGLGGYLRRRGRGGFTAAEAVAGD